MATTIYLKMAEHGNFQKLHILVCTGDCSPSLIKMLPGIRFSKIHYLNSHIYVCSLTESVYRLQQYWPNSTSAQYTRGNLQYTGGSVSLGLLRQLFLFGSS